MSVRVQVDASARGGLARSKPERRRAPEPDASRRQTAVTVPVLVLLAVLSLAGSIAFDLRLPSGYQWSVVGVLVAVAAVGEVVTLAFGPPADDSSPPWDAHTVWLLPGALLTPPAAFGALLVLSLTLSMARRHHSFTLRVVVSCITVLTTVAVHVAAKTIDSLELAALIGIAATWLIGAIVAVTAAHVFVSPSGTALWLDFRWSLVLLAAAFSGLLIAAAMTVDPVLGFAGIAPLLLTSFALRWPELTRHARIDTKTGLPNMQHWEARSRELLAAAALHQTAVTVMIIDLDEFKSINDTHGHLAGDQMLVALADTLRSQLNPGDLLGRFGGDEFVATLFHVSPADGLAAAERIRRAVAAQRHQITGARVGASAQECQITCTIGAASSKRYGYDLGRLLDLADTALVAAKHSGRNQVRSAAATLAESDAAMPNGSASDAESMSWWDVLLRREQVRHEQAKRNVRHRVLRD